MCQWNTGSKFLIDSYYIQIWKDIFRKASLIHACIRSWMLSLGCHIYPKFVGETQQNTTTDSQMSFPSTPTERQENKTELGAERSLRSLTCSREYRSKSSVSGILSILSLCKAQPDGWEKIQLWKIYSFHGRHEMVSSRSMWDCRVCFKK